MRWGWSVKVVWRGSLVGLSPLPTALDHWEVSTVRLRGSALPSKLLLVHCLIETILLSHRVFHLPSTCACLLIGQKSLWEGCCGGPLVKVHMLFSSLSNWLGNQWLRDTRVAVSRRADPKPCSLSSHFAAAPRQIWGFFCFLF